MRRLSPLVLAGVVCGADMVLLLAPAGSVVGGWQLVALLGLAVAAIVSVRAYPTLLMLAVPIIAFAVFRGAIVEVVDVPADAVLRDARAGIAALVIGGLRSLAGLAFVGKRVPLLQVSAMSASSGSGRSTSGQPFGVSLPSGRERQPA